jgi:hypothetical protein
MFLGKSAVPLDSKRFALHSLLEECKEERKNAGHQLYPQKKRLTKIAIRN